MDEFIDYLCRRYSVGHAYACAYVEYWNHTGKQRLASRQDLESLKDPESMWFDFALSANWRGRELAACLEDYRPVEGARYLDIGCGFGGMLVAFAEKGYEVHGIELDPVRVGLAKSNLSDIAGATVESGSILDKAYIQAQRAFDVITCIDVIEHVADVDAMVANATSLLAAGGTLHLEIPNKDAIDFVAADGHFSLFGITQLPRWAAIEYQQANFSFDYDVGDYYSLKHYEKLLERNGLEVVSRSSPLQPSVTWEEAERKARAIVGGFGRGLPHAKTVPATIRPYLDAAVDAYRGVVKAAWKEARKNPGLRPEFVSKFGARFWLLSAKKAAA